MTLGGCGDSPNMLKKAEPVSTSLWFPTAARRCLVTQTFHSQKIIQTMCQILNSWNISKCMQTTLTF
uniref:Alternative protein FMO1 n=1 Tax=Homo sapiens TaxID=9606 RepID=L8E7C3_HUMAN|nr:alternative protein FMO1 [Homo sapiens]